MIEAIVIKWLSEKMDVPVFAEVPEDAPASFLLVEKTSGRRTNYLSFSSIVVQSYDESLLKAAELNETVKACMFELIEVQSVSKVSLNANYNFTDTQTKRYRYQSVFDIAHFD